MKILLTCTIILLTIKSMGQYPFEKFKAINYQEFGNWIILDKSEKENKVHCNLTIPKFYSSSDCLTIQTTSFTSKWDSSFISIYKNKKQIQRIFEPMGLSPSNLYEPARIADINGDGLSDIKLVVS